MNLPDGYTHCTASASFIVNTHSVTAREREGGGGGERGREGEREGERGRERERERQRERERGRESFSTFDPLRIIHKLA